MHLNTLVALSLTAISLLGSCTSNNDLLIGIAEVNYTPEIGFDLEGNYRGDDYASRGIHDSLYARAIVAQGANGTKAALLTIDICMLKKDAVTYMRNYIASKTDIKAENVMVSVSHTHSGPKADINNPKVKAFLTKAAESVVQANGQMKPSELFAGQSTENRISHNRRLKCKDGSTHMAL
jgi:hypothetical protein